MKEPGPHLMFLTSKDQSNHLMMFGFQQKSWEETQ
jgi:hypothetical protein